ncbi:MAG: shikimate kinase [Rhabdochlamydiaceae bacterium]
MTAKVLILVGMMGVGKSAVGRRLAEISGREYFDTDSIVQHRVGRSIPQMFRIYGESAFREHESAALRSLEPSPIVLATGGGIVLRDVNWSEMRRLGHVVYLKAPTEVLINRLAASKKKRPLLEGLEWEEDVQKILSAREPFYEKAHVTVKVGDESVDEIAERVFEIFLELEKGNAD